MDARSTEIVIKTERETVSERGSAVKKRESESRGRTRSAVEGESVMMVKTLTKRGRTRAKRKRNVFGRRERMRILETPLATHIWTSLIRLPKMEKRRKV